MNHLFSERRRCRILVVNCSRRCCFSVRVKGRIAHNQALIANAFRGPSLGRRHGDADDPFRVNVWREEICHSSAAEKQREDEKKKNMQREIIEACLRDWMGKIDD